MTRYDNYTFQKHHQLTHTYGKKFRFSKHSGTHPHKLLTTKSRHFPVSAWIFSGLRSPSSLFSHWLLNSRKRRHWVSRGHDFSTLLSVELWDSKGKVLIQRFTNIDTSSKNLLVVSNPLKNISQNGNLPQKGVKIKNYLKPQTRKAVLNIVATIDFGGWKLNFCFSCPCQPFQK